MRNKDNNRIREKTGLLFVLFAVCLFFAGCGKADDMLAELKAESELLSEESTEEENAGKENTENEAGGEQGSSAAEVGETSNNSEITEEVIYVHVCGAVKSPGVYEMPVGSRIYKAVEAAGGFTEDAGRDYLNMARVLVDGSRLEIPTQEEAEALRKAGQEPEGLESAASGGSGTAGVTGSGGSGTAGVAGAESSGTAGAAGAGNSGTIGVGDSGTVGNLVNINTAGITELCTLPGIGETRAKAIVEYREQAGGFQKKEDIMQVSGIGEKMYEKMEAYFTV